MRTDLRGIAVGMAVFWGASALAQPAPDGVRCAPRPAVLELLTERHGETRRGIGMHGSGRVVEVFAADGGSWTIVATDPAGVTCLLVSGRGWEDLREALPPAGEPA